MILSLAILHVRHQCDYYKNLLSPLPYRMWWCYTSLPPLPALAKNVTSSLASAPANRKTGWGGGTGKWAHVEW
jgi:hypothetical protein